MLFLLESRCFLHNLMKNNDILEPYAQLIGMFCYNIEQHTEVCYNFCKVRTCRSPLGKPVDCPTGSACPDVCLHYYLLSMLQFVVIVFIQTCILQDFTVADNQRK